MKNDLYTINNEELIFKDNSTIKFDYPIKQDLLISNTIILRLEIPTKIIYNENIFGFSKKKKKKRKD